MSEWHLGLIFVYFDFQSPPLAIDERFQCQHNFLLIPSCRIMSVIRAVHFWFRVGMGPVSVEKMEHFYELNS